MSPSSWFVRLSVATLVSLGVVSSSLAATIGFEGVASPGGVLLPALPYVESGFTFSSVGGGGQNGIFDSASPIANTNGTDIFGWCAETCGGLQAITMVGPSAFSISSIDVSALFASAVLPHHLTVNLTGHFSGGGSIVASLPVSFVWVTHALAGFTGLSSLVITGLGSTSDQDPAIDNLVVEAVPEPAALLLLGLGVAAVRRRGARR